MAAPRRKTSGFSLEPLENPQETLVEITSEEVICEEEKTEEILPEEDLAPVLESITPTEDAGPRFVEKKQEEVAEVPETPTPVSVMVHPPKRNPRNIPRFSRYRKA
jgi:hypothetical protein